MKTGKREFFGTAFVASMLIGVASAQWPGLTHVFDRTFDGTLAAAGLAFGLDWVGKDGGNILVKMMQALKGDQNGNG